MKNLGWVIVGVIVAVLLFALTFQKQHDHDERMADKFAGLDQQKHAQVIELAQVEETITVRERVRNFFKSVAGIFGAFFH